MWNIRNGVIGLFLFSLMEGTTFAATVGIAAGDDAKGGFAPNQFRAACVYNDSSDGCGKTDGAYSCSSLNINSLPVNQFVSLSTGATAAKNVCYQLTLYPNDYNTGFSFDGSCEGFKIAPSISSGGNEVVLAFYKKGTISGTLNLLVTFEKMTSSGGSPGYTVKCQFNP